MPTQESDQRDAAYTTVPRSWIHTPSEAAAQRLVDILFVQVGATVSTQALGPKAPPSQQPQFPPSRNTQPFNTMQGWLEAPIRSQPFNNIEAFAIPEMKDKDLSREAGDEDYTIEEWSVAYYDLRE